MAEVVDFAESTMKAAIFSVMQIPGMKRSHFATVFTSLPTGVMERLAEDPTHWLFAGTGAKRGSTYPGLVGVEIDRAYPFSPATTRILAHSPVACADRGTTHSDLTVYTAASGAAVVSVGTMNWRSGISSDAPAPAHIPGSSVAFATRVTRNLLTGMARGPIGKDHPQRANLAQHRPSASTGTGTGGAVTGVQAR